MKSHPIESFGILPAKSGDIRVDYLEQRLNPRVPFPHKHDFFHILFITNGSGWHEIDFVRHKVKAGRIFVMKPGEVHSWKLSATTRGFVIEFTSESLPSNLRGKFLISMQQWSPYFDDVKESKLKNICEWMALEAQLRQPAFQLCLEGLLQSLLVNLSRLGQSKTIFNPNDRFTEKFKSILEENFKKQHSVDFYAKKMGLSAKALTMRISRKLGKSARSLIQDRCMIEAKRLLAYSDATIAEISYELGFEDPNYFARFFTAHNKIAPGRYRKLAQKTIS